jgi:hypothetical protein
MSKMWPKARDNTRLGISMRIVNQPEIDQEARVPRVESEAKAKRLMKGALLQPKTYKHLKLTILKAKISSLNLLHLH